MPGTSPGMTSAASPAALATEFVMPQVTRSVQRQPHQIAVVLTGIAVRRLVEGIGELPFLRLVAPLRRGVADDVVGTAGVADRRGTGGPARHLQLDQLRPVLGDPVLSGPVLDDF